MMRLVQCCRFDGELGMFARRALVGFVAALGAMGVSAQLPPAATPGGALPALPNTPTPQFLEDGAFPIPPSPERPMRDEDGDRIFVQEFAIEGVSDRPEHGVSIEDLVELLENTRINSQGLDKVGSDGFTEDERKEVVEFFQRVVSLREFDDFLYEDYNDLVTRLREERFSRRSGLTIVQLQRVADQVTAYYRSKGFILAQAFIPAQDVEGGRVEIEVVEGRLGNVLAQGNEKYDLEVLAEPFDELIDSPVTNAGIEEAILTLVTDKGIQTYRPYPGLRMSAVFRPGTEVGTSDLVLGVREEKPIDVALQIDNNGSRFTGERRVQAEFYWNNPLGVGDRVDLQLTQNYLPKGNLFYSAGYNIPVPGHPSSWFEISAGKQMFTVGADQKALGISGETNTLGASFYHTAFANRFHEMVLRTGLERQDAITK
ncbi:MAG: ShlB/FhaC/HecB family hemolysin secretion/activation protein, partial [Chromatiales bacterium]|nr:ShlB/FhaC/HecB family hemolysin secretion/activation protein [Chromatiales bacterium]